MKNKDTGKGLEQEFGTERRFRLKEKDKKGNVTDIGEGSGKIPRKDQKKVLVLKEERI